MSSEWKSQSRIGNDVSLPDAHAVDAPEWRGGVFNVRVAHRGPVRTEGSTMRPWTLIQIFLALSCIALGFTVFNLMRLIAR
jgi:hypothetical protein